MFYITLAQSARAHQVSLEDILKGEIPTYCFTPYESTKTGTMTHLVQCMPRNRINQLVDLNAARIAVENFVRDNRGLMNEDREKLYHTFYIPKKSGGLRRIDEPNAELMAALRNLKSILENQFHVLYHTSAFAYVPGRCTVDAIRKHQQNQSNWFLKTDFSNFFGSTTLEYTMETLSRIFPFNYYKERYGERYWNELKDAIELGFLNGGLPQGTPLSPMLTNVLSIPIDHTLRNTLVKQGFVYTRYADDILISHRKHFDYGEICKLINDTLNQFHAPYRIKDSKTRYGSRSGNNWNLGVMLNKDNNITVGWRKKQQFKAMCSSYIMDKKNNKNWEAHDVSVLSGLISYYKMIEPEYFEKLIGFINQKFNVNLKKMIRKDLRGE